MSERLKQYQLERVAMMVVSARSPKEIAKKTGISEDQISRLTQGGVNATFDRLRDGFDRMSMIGAERHKYRLLELGELTYSAVNECLTDGSKELKLKATQAVWNELGFSKANGQANSEGDILRETLANPQVQGQIADTFKNINRLMEGISTWVEGGGADTAKRYEKIGVAALPITTTVSQLTEGDPLPDPAKTDGSWELEEVESSE